MLVFSSVGYKEQQVPVNNESPLSIQMVSTTSTLGEVVVVSYGTQKKRDITGSISQLSVAEVKDMPVADIGQKLQGKFAGVQINQTSAEPSSNIPIHIQPPPSTHPSTN